jgi:hypothetical protein
MCAPADPCNTAAVKRFAYAANAEDRIRSASCHKRSLASYEHRGIRPGHNSFLADQRGR